MDKYLLAIVCNSQTHARNATRLMCNFLDTEHRSMQAPVIDAIHAATGIDKHTIMMDANPFELYPLVNSTMGNLKTRVQWAFTQNNPAFLVAALDQWLNSPEEKANHNIFTGVAITDISSDFQADYFRKNKGIVIHILLANSHLPHPAKPQKGDLVITLNNSELVQQEVIFQYCDRIKGIYRAHLQGSLFNNQEAA